MGGPIWNQPIHDVEFVKRLFKVARENESKDLAPEKREVNLGTTKRI